VQGGVLVDQCASFLQDFFKRKRDLIKMTSSPVREDALRTPDSRFDQLPDYPWAPNYVSDLPTLAGLRMHFLDEGPRGAPLTYLCLHANPAWSYQYRKMIPVLLSACHRVVAPDLIGFGKSDKPKKDTFHAFAWHRQVLLELVERLDLKNIVLVVQDGGDLLGLTLPLADAHRYRGLLVMNSVLEIDPECAGYGAPFPDRGHRAALRAFSCMMSDFEKSGDTALSRQARDFWENEWLGQTLMADGLQDQAIAQAAIDYFVAP
jgi:tRNA(adenine34) deaminase